MKVFFSDRPALYFLKEYADKHLTDSGLIKWTKVDHPTFSSGLFFDKLEIQQCESSFHQALASLEDNSLICFSMNEFGDYFSFVLLYKLYVDFLDSTQLENISFVVGGVALQAH